MSEENVKAAAQETAAEPTEADEAVAETAATAEAVAEIISEHTAEATPETLPVPEAALEGSTIKESENETRDHSVVAIPEADSSDSDNDEYDYRKLISTDVLQLNQKPRKPSVIDEDYDDRLNSIGDNDSEWSPKSLSQHSLVEPKELDFFEQLGEIPALSEISSDFSDELIADALAKRVSAAGAGQHKDTGQFVNPLTGLVESSTTEEEQMESTPTPVEEVEEEEDSEIVEDDDLLEFDIDDEVELEEKMPGEDDAFETFLEMEAPKIIITEEAIDFEELAREKEERLIRSAVVAFLDDVIADTVNTCEYVDPKIILRQNLNKAKLMLELQHKLVSLDVEQKAKFFLNRKTVEYFRRKKAFRSIMEENPDALPLEKEKYEEAKLSLDRALGVENETIHASKLKIDNLSLELLYKENENKQEVRAFEDLVKKTLNRESYDKLKVVVDQQLSRMAVQRNQVSEMRLHLIENQHTYAAMLEEMNKLENIGNGLRMVDFEHLYTDAQALDKKVEERSVELGKLRLRYNADLHIQAHLKEKQQTMRNTIHIQENALNDLMDTKQSLRAYVHKLKMDRGRVRKELQELSFQGGLLDKPALMLDYDDTIGKLEKLRIRVEEIKVKHAEMQQKLQQEETRQERSL